MRLVYVPSDDETRYGVVVICESHGRSPGESKKIELGTVERGKLMTEIGEVDCWVFQSSDLRVLQSRSKRTLTEIKNEIDRDLFALIVGSVESVPASVPSGDGLGEGLGEQ